MRNFKTVLLILAVCAAGILLSTLNSHRAAVPQLNPPQIPAKTAVLAADPVVSAPPAAVSVPPAAPILPEKIPLITGGAASDILWTDRTPAARRVRRIFPDEKMMTSEPVLKKGDAIELALFDDVVLDAEISNVTLYPNGSVGLTAHLRNGREGTLFLSYCGGEMRASVKMIGGADFYVKYNPETRTHYAVEVDRENSIVLEGAEPLIPPADDAVADVPASPASAEPVVLADAPAGSTIVDVMIVYTPAARTAEGGTNGIINNINLAMQKANEAHTNSNTQVYLNLVHSTEVTYTEVDAYTDLNNLTYSNETYSAMDEVHSLRNQYGADMICLFESTSEVGGVGWLLDTTSGRANRAFCLARVQQSDWTYTVVHEWGHNMGCSHSKTQTVQPWTGELYSFSAGWQWNDTRASSPAIGYCSVMTYEDFNNDGTDEYIRVGYFSNPDINYAGNSTNATGHAADGNNALTIRNMKTVLAGYRAAVVPATVTLSLSGSPMAESGGVARVTATLSAASAQTVTVNLAFSGAATWTNDYTRSATNIVIAAGSTTNSITLTAVQDSFYEGSENIVVDISSVANGTESGTQQVTATITDDDPELNVTPSSGVTFIGAAGAITSPSNQVYVLTNAGSGTLNWAASRNSNWVILSATNGTLTAGATTNVTVSLNTASLAEGTYSGAVAFSNVTRGVGTARLISLTVTPPYVYFFPLDTNPGWTRNGEWAFGHPAGQGGTAHGNPDPSNGFSGTNVFGVNLNGDYSVALGGPYYLTAGPFDFSGYTNVILHFQRWLNTDIETFVPATIDISSNGTAWIRIYTSPGEVSDSGWNRRTNNISNVADRQATVYVRWGYQLINGGGDPYAYSGWNIDDIGFLGTAIYSPDTDGDGLPNEWELQYFGGTTNADPNAFVSNGVNTVLGAYIAGLNPTNSASFFKVNTFEIPAVSNGGFVIGWNAVSGRVYSVYWMTNLPGSFEPLKTNIVWPQSSYTDTVHDAETRGFYKINVRLAP